MTLQDILREAQALSADERRELIKMLVDTVGKGEENIEPASTKRSLHELRGLSKESWEGSDAQEYVDQLRNEWDHRP
jgi:hypothetical protein